MNNSIGLYIPNGDYNFKCRGVKAIGEYFFIITQNDEIITYKNDKQSLDLKKRYILFSHQQKRERIKDVFLFSKPEGIYKDSSMVIVTVTENLVINLWDINDGLCVNKVNLSAHQSDGELSLFQIENRFLLFFFRSKTFVFDVHTLVIAEEESLQFEVKKIYKFKENKFFIISSADETHVLEIKIKNSICPDLTSRIMKHTFSLKKIFNDESNYTLINNQEMIYHNLGQSLKISFIDSVEELSELACLNTDHKSKIVFIEKLQLESEEILLVIYKDLYCELFSYDKVHRDIIRRNKFAIMIEDEFANMKFAVYGNVLIGYGETHVHLFNLNKFFTKEEKYVDKTIDLADIFGLYRKDLYFTNYFKENFESYHNDLIRNLSDRKIRLVKDYYNQSRQVEQRIPLKITASAFLTDISGDSVYYIAGFNNGKITMIDIFLNRDLHLNPVLFIDYHTTCIKTLNIYDNRYLISSSEDGMITVTDISGTKTASERKSSIASINNDKDSESTPNYYYSKKKSLIGKDISNFMILESESDKEENNLKLVNILPVMTYKNYYKLHRIIPITQLDNFCLNIEESLKPVIRNFLAFELENDQIQIVDMDKMKIVYTFSINTTINPIEAIYEIAGEKCFVFYLKDNTVKISNYVTKKLDRTVSDINKIYSILRVEEKLNKYLANGGEKMLIDEFPTKLNKNLKEETKDNKISIDFICNFLKDENEKKLFMKKYLHNAYHQKKYQLNITMNKFEAVWIRKIESYIIDDIFRIINCEHVSEVLKKIKILNLLSNPLIHNKIFNRFDYDTTGVEESILHIGNQVNEFLNFNVDDFCLLIEKMTSNKKLQNKTKQNIFYNFISLFRIWNISIDQDIAIYTNFGISQPLFEFNMILKGCEGSLSLILNEEAQTDGDMNDQFKFFMNFLNANEKDKKNLKNEKFFNKKYLINRQQGYLVNYKNLDFSSNLSHFMNLSFFGSMISSLGFYESNDICRIMSAEKMLLRSLSQQNYIKYSGLEIIDKYMFDCTDSVTIANKDIILFDYLAMQYMSQQNEEVKDLSVKYCIEYLDSVYSYIFGGEDQVEINRNFYKFHKDKNVDSKKLNLLAEIDLSIISTVITFNSIAKESDRLDELPSFRVAQLLIIFVFKILSPSFSHFLRPNVSKTVVELLSKSTEIMGKIYKENSLNYAKLLMDFYVSIKYPIDLEGLFKKYEIGDSVIIKSEENLNFLKIMLAKLIKNYSKSNIGYLIKNIMEEFKRRSTEYDYCSYLLEILWIIFREKSSKHVNYLPLLVDLIIKTMSPQNKEMKSVCLDNSKKILSCLLPNYPMISFHQKQQRLAVGANDGMIFIYDIASCSIWKNLSAHTNEITALSFDFTGNILISYSSTESSVKFWKIGLTNFFSSFFSVKDGYYKSNKFKPIEADIPADERLATVKFQLMPKNDNKVVLIREDKTVEVLNL